MLDDRINKQPVLVDKPQILMTVHVYGDLPYSKTRYTYLSTLLMCVWGRPGRRKEKSLA